MTKTLIDVECWCGHGWEHHFTVGDGDTDVCEVCDASCDDDEEDLK